MGVPAELEYLLIADRFHVAPHEVWDWPEEVLDDARLLMTAESRAQAWRARQRRHNRGKR